MSIKTKLLELFKYEPDKDGAQTFNIKSALNDNWDKIEAWAQSVKTALAGLVPTSRKVNGKNLGADITLTAADIKMPDSEEDVGAAMAKRLWRYTQMWNTVDVPTTVDAVNQLEPGCYGFVLTECMDWMPPDLEDFLARYELIVHNVADKNQNGTVRLRCIDGAYNLMEYIGEILIKSEGLSIRWRRVATCMPPEVHELPLAAGWVRFDATCRYYKTQESVVIVSIAARTTQSFQVSAALATLPEGFRPAADLEVPAIFKGSRRLVTIKATADGNLFVDLTNQSGVAITSDDYFFATFAFMTT